MLTITACGTSKLLRANVLYWDHKANQAEADKDSTRNKTICLAVLALAISTLPRTFALNPKKKVLLGLIELSGLIVLAVSLLIFFSDKSDYAEASSLQKRWSSLETEAHALFERYAEMPDKDFKIRTESLIADRRDIETAESPGPNEEWLRECEKKAIHYHAPNAK